MNASTNWEDVYRTQTARIAELEATLDAVTAANERAAKRWQAAFPGKELVIPDQAKMVEWLLEDNAALRKEIHIRLLIDERIMRKDQDELIELRKDKARLEVERCECLRTMTLRDHFAAQALVGLLAHPSGEDPKMAVNFAYRLADAMLEQRARKEAQP